MNILLAQPNETGIAGNMFVPPAENRAPPSGQWMLTLYQPNPNTANGELIANAWNAGALTGFTPVSPATAQVSFTSGSGSSTAQMEGGVVGAYITSADLPGSPTFSKMMIAPQYDWTSQAAVNPFANPLATLNYSLQLQIPTATGLSYCTVDTVFYSQDGAKLEIGAKLFTNGSPNMLAGVNFNSDSNDYTAAAPVQAGQAWLTPAPGSSSAGGSTWTGWQTFAWSVSYAQFQAMLVALNAAFPQALISTDPTQYTMTQTHLNAEFHFNPGASSLGWSMQNFEIFTNAGS